MSAIHWARLTLAASRVEAAEDGRKRSVEQLRSLMTNLGDKPPTGIEGRKLAELVSSNGALPEAKSLAQEVGLHFEIERIAILELRRAMRAHPLGEWCSEQVGIGEKTLGRLLGLIGDPTLRVDRDTGEVTERALSQLRSYCGYGDAEDQQRRRGQKANWNADARRCLHNIAEPAMKCSTSPYRKVYEDAREKYADAVHATDCKRCGPSGRPAPAGSPLSDGHKHARALRAIKKAFLADLWREARRVHERVDDQMSDDSAGDLEGAIA